MAGICYARNCARAACVSVDAAAVSASTSAAASEPEPAPRSDRASADTRLGRSGRPGSSASYTLSTP